MAPGYQKIGQIPLNKKATKDKPSQALIEKSLGEINDTIYAPTTWTKAAYLNIFEKFNYAEPTEFDKDAWDHAMNVLKDEYSYMDGSKWTPLALTEKNHDSSPGLPAMLYYQTEKDLIQDEGFACSEHMYKMMTQGDTPDIVWYGFLKNETIKREKIEKEDIRLICCAPSAYTRLGACFETEMNSRMKERVHEKQAQVGFVPFHFPQRVGPCTGQQVLELDFTRYDGTIPKMVLDAVDAVRLSSFAGNKKQRAAYRIYRKMLWNRTMALATGDVVKMNKGNPSGQFSTSADNCIAHTAIWAYILAIYWKRLTGNPCYPKDWVRTYTYGDDHLSVFNQTEHGVNPPPCEFLTSVAKSHLGMWVKPENVKYTMGLEGASFCGQTFFIKKGKVRSTFRTDKVFSSIVEPSQPAKTLEDLEQKLDSALVLCAYDTSEYARRIDSMVQKMQILDPGYEPVDRKTIKTIWVGPKEL